MLLGVIRGEYDQRIAFFNNLFYAAAQGNAHVLRPAAVTLSAGVGTVHSAPGIFYTVLAAAALVNPGGVMVRMPFMQKIINKSNRFHG